METVGTSNRKSGAPNGRRQRGGYRLDSNPAWVTSMALSLVGDYVTSVQIFEGLVSPRAATVAWYPLSLRTDSVNRGMSISFLMLAIVVLLVSFGVSLFFFIPECCHVMVC
jgi:hypothetical protein